jgi:pilus assembly protein CpaE
VTGALVVAGAAGGCGASTLAGALALCWAAAGARPWLLELDLERGDLAGAWDLPLDRTIADLAPVAAELDEDHLRAAAFPHPTGVVLLPGPGRPGASTAWEPAGLARLVDAAAGAGQVVVDAGAGLGRAGMAAAGRAGGILLVCPPTLGGARRARRLLEALGATGAEGRAALVAGGAPGHRELGVRALRRALGANVAGELPWAPGEAAELAAGRWSPGRRRPLHHAVERLAEAIG